MLDPTLFSICNTAAESSGLTKDRSATRPILTPKGKKVTQYATIEINTDTSDEDAAKKKSARHELQDYFLFALSCIFAFQFLSYSFMNKFKVAFTSLQLTGAWCGYALCLFLVVKYERHECQKFFLETLKRMMVFLFLSSFVEPLNSPSSAIFNVTCISIFAVYCCFALYITYRRGGETWPWLQWYTFLLSLSVLRIILCTVIFYIHIAKEP